MEHKNQGGLTPNYGKKLVVDLAEGRFARFPVKTHVVKPGESLAELLDTYVKEHLQDGDQIYMSEKMVSISQGRAVPISEIHPSKLALFLLKFVYKSPYGVGLGSPYTMELAIRDIGAPLILFGAFCAAITKPFGIRGVFYKVVGNRARTIDGPADYVLPPYDKYAKMSPLKPQKVSCELAKHIGHDVCIIDANDLGLEVLGNSNKKKISKDFVRRLFKDNPLDQSIQQTPIAIVRRVPDDFVEPEWNWDAEEAAAVAEKSEGEEN